MQAVHNSAARIVTQERLRDHDSMSRVLMELHWLPVDKRVEYKLLLYTYKALHGLCYGHKINLPRFNDLLISEARNQQQRQEYVQNCDIIVLIISVY